MTKKSFGTHAFMVCASNTSTIGKIVYHNLSLICKLGVEIMDKLPYYQIYGSICCKFVPVTTAAANELTKKSH